MLLPVDGRNGTEGLPNCQLHKQDVFQLQGDFQDGSDGAGEEELHAIEIGREHREAGGVANEQKAKGGAAQPKGVDTKEVRLQPQLPEARRSMLRCNVEVALGEGGTAQEHHGCHGQDEAQLLHHRAALLEEAHAAEKRRSQLRHRGERHQQLHRHQRRGQTEGEASQEIHEQTNPPALLAPIWGLAVTFSQCHAIGMQGPRQHRHQRCRQLHQSQLPLDLC
mmetsp:Transcript_41498/g.65810  ORF Transcript_41498/g.65810 Transcript_41498/m.65810 type:complete len:222 (-) Transcript_41498:152-817(-)